ncbi:zyxin-like [Xiphophorus couchianus]|uniref:zyxin-like n=1 Tax=Xiphophorus couchianus TaxID=32473 RepID=UPI0010165C3D|nr:zyxin-like [Xiphophorus couchianus]
MFISLKEESHSITETLQQKDQMDSAKLTCCICLDLLKSPATIPCGHSYCMNCIKSCWDREDQKGVYSCPQCRKKFTMRPGLVKNIVLAELVEDLKKTGLQAAPADHYYAGPEDVTCDVCSGRKMKAVKSCLVCLASFCEKHIQPHYESFTFSKHKLVEVSAKPQQNFSSRHDEVRKILFDKYKRDPNAAERTEKPEFEVMRQQLKQRLQNREKDVKLLPQKMRGISVSDDKAEEDSEASLPSSDKKRVKSRPLSVPLPPGPDPVPVGGVAPNMKKLIKIFNKDKPAPVPTSTPTKICGKCGKDLSSTQPALKAMGKAFHPSCFCCMSCHRPLQGMQFYDKEGSPECKRCYVTSLASCSQCGEKITDHILKAMGKCFHVRCFLCSTCSCTLDGLPFIAGEDNKPYCIQDYHKHFSPQCEACKEPIVPAQGSEERVKLVALGKNYHIECYQCEDCARPFSSEEDKYQGYPLDGRFLCIKCHTKRTRK